MEGFNADHAPHERGNKAADYQVTAHLEKIIPAAADCLP
jgi:hypothetical protein